MSTVEHIVICQQVITVPAYNSDGRDFKTIYEWSGGERYATREKAIEAGFGLGRSDDFNIAILTDGRLTWFGWMGERLEYNLAEIAEQIGVEW